jgi:stearoyl-CoA desaturase (delta-9 desaturase)
LTEKNPPATESIKLDDIQLAQFHPPEGVSLRMRIATLLAVCLPFAGVVFAVIQVWGWGITWLHLGLLLSMYMLTAVGITVGYHRLFTHRSFETYSINRFIFAVLGAMAVEGPVLKWVAVHRRHHQHSDSAADPHSPHHHGPGFLGFLGGLWHAHMGWVFESDPADLKRYVGDLVRDRWVRIASNTWLIWALVGLTVPAILGGIISGSWAGVLLGFIWGGLVRVFLVHHVTWSVNSICHIWGTRPFNSRDESRNNLVFGLLGLGEGWHNNHHAFPTSARHGLAWWEIDISYWIIKLMELTGLAWKVRVPAMDAIDAKRL